MDRSKSGELTLPVGEDTEGFCITVLSNNQLCSHEHSKTFLHLYLIEFAVIAAGQLGKIGIRVLENWKARLIPEFRIVTSCIICISEVEVEIPPIARPFYFVLGWGKWYCNVLEPFEAYQAA